MGQYYRPILGDSYGLSCKVFDRTVDGEYTFAKLLEHSWWKNPFVNAFSEKLYEEPGRVCWVGDYADEPEISASATARHFMYRATVQSGEIR